MANGRSVHQTEVSRVVRVTSHFLRGRQSYILKLLVSQNWAILLCFHLGGTVLHREPCCVRQIVRKSVCQWALPRKVVLGCVLSCLLLLGLTSTWKDSPLVIINCLVSSGLGQARGLQPSHLLFAWMFLSSLRWGNSVLRNKPLFSAISL